MTRVFFILAVCWLGVLSPRLGWSQQRSRAFQLEGDEVKAVHRQRVKMLQKSAGMENLSLMNYQAFHRFKAQMEEEQRLQAITGYSPLNGSWAQINLQVSKLGMGRINCMTVHPTNPQIIYVGTPTGGLWRTMDGGTTWTELTRAMQVPGVSGICIDPTNTQVIYILTGSASSVECQSLGVFKTTDGGINWYATGFSVDFTPNWFYDTAAINAHELMMHPTNPSILFAATTKGLYRTADGGATWALTEGGDILDVEIHPTDPNVVYVTRRGGFVLISNDGGISFGGPRFARLSAPAGTSYGSCTMAVTPAAPDSLFFLLSRRELISGVAFDTLEVVVARVDKLNRNLLGRRLPNMYFTGMEAPTDYVTSALRWYRDGRLAISRTTTREMYIGGLWVYATNDFGENFINKAFAANDSLMVHSDCTFIGYINNQLYTTNDGGIYRQTPSPTSAYAAWTNLTSAMPIAQIFRMGISQTNMVRYPVALQDNGIHVLGNTSYIDYEGGDGVMARMSHTDSNVFYSRTNAFRTIRWTGNQSVDISPNAQQGFTFIPFEVDRQTSDRLYTATDSLFISNNKGDSWFRMRVGATNNIKLLAVSPVNYNVIWLLEDYKLDSITNDTIQHARLWRTMNGGASFTQIPLPIGMPIDYISSLTVGENSSDRLYLTFDGYFPGYKVWWTPNATQIPASGITWLDLNSEQLPNIPINCLLNESETDAKLYIGSDIGVFHRSNSFGRWIPFMNGMPLCRVTEIHMNRVQNFLICATYGRGLFQGDLHNGSCVPVLNLVGTQSGNQTFSAGTTLNSVASLQGGQATQIRYYSAVDLFLNPGFQSGYGTPWLATVAPCGGVVNSFLRQGNSVTDGPKDNGGGLASTTIQTDSLRAVHLKVDSLKAEQVAPTIAPYKFDPADAKPSTPASAPIPPPHSPALERRQKKASNPR